MKERHTLPGSLARIHSWIHSRAWLGRFTLMNRILLAIAFIPTGLVKATGHRFTTLPVDNPIGFFFEAMYRTGPYWYFIGLSQLAAAVLLLIPATATVGALLFFPIIVNIVLVTWGIGFEGTIYVTLLMLLANLWLLSWDADRIWAAGAHVLGSRRTQSVLRDANLLEKCGWVLGGSTGIAFFLATRGFIPKSAAGGLIIVGACAVLMVVVGGISGIIGSRESATKGP